MFLKRRNNVFNETDIKDLLNDKALDKEEKIKQINKYYEDQRKQYDKELNTFLLKSWGGELLELLSCVIPVGAGTKVGSTVGKAFISSKLGKALVEKFVLPNASQISKNVAKSGLKLKGNLSPKNIGASIKKLKALKENNFLIKRFGRKIPNQIGAGIKSGAVSGGVYGAGEGLQNDKNIFSEAAKGAVAGSVIGANVSGGLAFAERYLRGLKLKNYGDIDKLPDNIRTDFQKYAKAYFQDYIQQIEIKINGKIIKFTAQAAKEQSKWNPKLGRYYSELVNDIKNAKRIYTVENTKPAKKPLVKEYEVYEGKNGKHYVEVSKNGERRFYITKDNIENTSNGTLRFTKPGSKGSATTSITDDQEAVNPDSENGGFLKGYVEKNVNLEGTPTGFATPLSDSGNSEDVNKTKMYTPEQLALKKEYDELGVFLDELCDKIAAKEPNSRIRELQKMVKEVERKRALKFAQAAEARRQAQLRYRRQAEERRRKLAEDFEEYFRTVLDDFIIRQGFDMHDYT